MRLPHGSHERPMPARGAQVCAQGALVLLVLLAGACQRSHPASNSNTSWLVLCDESADCGELECLCGRCTTPCTQSAECSSRFTGGSCEQTSGPALAQACDAHAPEAICVLRCAEDGDCDAAGDGLVCRGALCVALPPPPPDGGVGSDAGARPSPPDGGAGSDAGARPDAGDSCPDGEIVDSADRCLLDSAFCRPLADGRYCTGSSAPSCPWPSVPIGADEPCPVGATCTVNESQGRCQELPEIDVSTCSMRGGRVTYDPGDGSLYRSGCPLDRAEIARIAGGVEGGLCCALELVDCAPQAPHYTGTCEPASRYYWVGYTCVGRTGCDCEGPDCGAGTSTEAECLMRFAGCAAITQACGGFSAHRCADEEYCAYIAECGLVDGASICIPRPEACPEYVDPVCGCDGQVYSNVCFANMAGTGMLRFGTCN
jgi:hypothetical protein